MSVFEKLKARKGKAVACAAVAAALAVACGALAGCPAAPDAGGDGVPAIDSKGVQASSSPEAGSGTSTVGDEGDGAAEEPSAGDTGRQSEPDAVASGETAPQDAVSGVSGGVSQPGSATRETAPTPAPAAAGAESGNQHTWVADYEDVWVEDSPAWDESVPVYGSVEVSICNVCGADVTGNAAAHGKQHMLAGEGSGHHSEVRETIVGYETVRHDATGHWERVESGGRWE